MGGFFESFGINVPSLIAQAVNFGVLFGLLYLVAYKPIMRMMDARSNKIRESLEQAERIKQQADVAEQETAKKIEAAGQEARALINQAMASAENMRQKAQVDAKADAEKLIAQARGQIGQERDEAIGELRKEFADLTVLAAEKVIKRSLDKEAQRKLIEQVLEESSGLKNN
ncbi:MAG: ATP synthase F0 subunit B [Dehalococcoidia bacterium]|nr:MAG: ATP synthase F0 subunit B [Dehalococcoidia bacterium]